MLCSQVEETALVRPVCLPQLDQLPSPDSYCYITGWGHMGNRSKWPHVCVSKHKRTFLLLLTVVINIDVEPDSHCRPCHTREVQYLQCPTLPLVVGEDSLSPCWSYLWVESKQLDFFSCPSSFFSLKQVGQKFILQLSPTVEAT